MDEKYILLDGNNLAHIAFHRAKSIILKNKIKQYVESLTKKGKTVWVAEKEAKQNVQIEKEDYKAISGMMLLVFFRKLHKHFKKFTGTFIMTWDNPNSHEWRKQVYPDYKCRRDYEHDPIWEILFNNINEIKNVLNYYPMSQIGVEGLEADDIIYLYSKFLSKHNTVIIVSSDSDLVQIAQEFKNVKVYHPIKDIYVNIPKDYDVVIYKAFKGDKTDDIGGVPGFGEKKALKAAREIASGIEILNVIENAIPKKTKKDVSNKLNIVKENLEIIKRNLTLIKISNNPILKNLTINKSLFVDVDKINLKEIQKFYFKHKLLSLLEEFATISAIFS